LLSGAANARQRHAASRRDGHRSKEPLASRDSAEQQSSWRGTVIAGHGVEPPVVLRREPDRHAWLAWATDTARSRESGLEGLERSGAGRCLSVTRAEPPTIKPDALRKALRWVAVAGPPPSVQGYLAEILAVHRAQASVAMGAGDLAERLRRAKEMPPARPFAAALRQRSEAGLAVIAEIKRRSPSKGILDADLDPGALARSFAAGGATCLSVLTDEQFFGGSVDDLLAARRAVELPILRKDFTVCVADLCDARLMGADAVLLIVAALEDDELCQLLGVATDLGLDALVEVHDEAELERALAAGAQMIGVNQRDLRSFTVDADRALALVQRIPEGLVAVAESGIRGPDDAARLADAGYQAVLVGESLLRSPDRVAAVRALGRAAVRERRVRDEPAPRSLRGSP